MKQEIKKFSKQFKISKPRSIDWKIKLLWFSPIIIIAFIVRFPDYRKDYLLEHYGKQSVAIIDYSCTTEILNAPEGDNVIFHFLVDNKIYKGFESVPANNNYVFTPFGMPLKPGHKFILTYYPENPEIYRIDLNKPLSNNMLDYLFKVAGALRQSGVCDGYGNDTQTRLCVGIYVFKLYGFDGWADIMFYDEYLLENFRNNGFSFRKLTHSDKFRAILNDCKNRQ